MEDRLPGRGPLRISVSLRLEASVISLSHVQKFGILVRLQESQYDEKYHGTLLLTRDKTMYVHWCICTAAEATQGFLEISEW